MYRWFLAIRYLWSRPVSWISMVGIWLSVTATILTLAIMTGLLCEHRSVFLGVTPEDQDPATAPRNHSPLFFADESALNVGVRALANLTVDYMLKANSNVDD